MTAMAVISLRVHVPCAACTSSRITLEEMEPPI
jgi:hypothetical protein